jgi:hypothetical protein
LAKLRAIDRFDDRDWRFLCFGRRARLEAGNSRAAKHHQRERCGETGGG